MIKDDQMPDSEPAKVAIVDDDASVRDSLQFLIEILGHPVQTFESAVDFLRAEVRRFSHLILDHHMPQMTGLDLAEQLREAELAIPIMLITGSLTPDMIERAKRLSIARVLEKPPSEQEINSFISGDNTTD